MIFHAVDGIGGSGIYVSRHSGLRDLGIMPPEPPHDLAAAERLIQLSDALLEHGPYRHDHIVRDPGGRRIRSRAWPVCPWPNADEVAEPPCSPVGCRMMAAMGGAGELSEPEQRAWEAFATGMLVDFGTGDATADDPAGGETWGTDRQVRAEVIAALLRGVLTPAPGHAGRVWLRCARITGLIDLQDAEVRHALRLERCHVADGADLTDASGRTTMLVGCQVGTVSLLGANSVHSRGSVNWCQAMAGSGGSQGFPAMALLMASSAVMPWAAAESR